VSVFRSISFSLLLEPCLSISYLLVPISIYLFDILPALAFASFVRTLLLLIACLLSLEHPRVISLLLFFSISVELDRTRSSLNAITPGETEARDRSNHVSLEPGRVVDAPARRRGCRSKGRGRERRQLGLRQKRKRGRSAKGETTFGAMSNAVTPDNTQDLVRRSTVGQCQKDGKTCS
jgi:hypothetical protein